MSTSSMACGSSSSSSSSSVAGEGEIVLLGVGTTAAMIFFGTNLLLWLFFQFIVRSHDVTVRCGLWKARLCSRGGGGHAPVQNDADVTDDGDAVNTPRTHRAPPPPPASQNKKLSKPFVGTVDCFVNLTRDLGVVGLVFLTTYVRSFVCSFVRSFVRSSDRARLEFAFGCSYLLSLLWSCVCLVCD